MSLQERIAEVKKFNHPNHMDTNKRVQELEQMELDMLIQQSYAKKYGECPCRVSFRRPV